MFEFLLTLLTVIFVIMIISVALTFGFFLLVWFIGVAVAAAVFVFLRGWWRRIMFVYRGRKQFPKPPPPPAPPPRKASDIIEAEFEELPPHD